MRFFYLLTLSFFILFAEPSSAKLTWQEWVDELRIEAINQGISAELFDQIFNSIPEPDHKVIHFDKSQPERRITFLEYRNTRADQYKILIGRKAYQKNKALLDGIGVTYGVDPCIIVGLWGMESDYGHYMGNFPVIKSLATLAYDERRGERFRRELLLALKIVNEGQIPYEKFKGEWAGASGQPQFLPSSWFKYAVDYDQDGRKDIWTSNADALASIANYLAKNGWQQKGQTVMEVQLPQHFPQNLISKKIRKSVSEWNTLGVRTVSLEKLPGNDNDTSVIQLEGGTTFLIYPNFRVIMTYNYSSYYAATIVYMADKICKR